jgi:hypothetical protein
VIGVDPAPLTFRELVSMRRGRDDAAWWHTAALRCDLANMLRGKDAPVRMPVDFHPMHKDEAPRDWDRLPKLSFKQVAKALTANRKGK